jgi:hypothetical protein
VRRDDAADGLVLHVLELREQHGLRLAVDRRPVGRRTSHVGLDRDALEISRRMA